MYRQIVVGVHPGVTAAGAARRALALGATSGAQVHLVCALPADPTEPDRRQAGAYLQGLLCGASAATRTHLRAGDPADVLLSVAAEVEADLLVVGGGGLQGARRSVGTVPDTVSRLARCRVDVVCTFAPPAASAP